MRETERLVHRREHPKRDAMPHDGASSAADSPKESPRDFTEETGEFFAMLSHELRGPLTIISGDASLLRRSGHMLTPDERAQALADISVEAERVSVLIEG